MVGRQISSGRRAAIIQRATAAARKDWVAYTRTQEAEIYRLFEQAADRLHRQILASQTAGVLPPARLVALLGDPKNPHPDSVLGVMRDLRPRLSARIQIGMSKSVDYGLHTQIAAATAAVGTNRWKTTLSAGQWAKINTDAMDALIRFKPNGIMFSDRVWKISNDTQTYLRNRINQAVALGEPVQNVARDIKKYLVEPNKLFRRVRDPKTGKLRLSRAAQAYHPGRGVYRSAHANAMRLAQTEMARAYNEGAWRYMQEKKWIDGGIWRTVHFTPCPECIALEDRFFPKDAMPSMPLHPWCYCQWEMHIKGEPIAAKPPLPAEVKRHLGLAPERQKRGATPAKVKKAADVPKPTKVQDLKTTGEMQSWAEAKYPDIKWDFSGGVPETIGPTISQFDKLARQYPSVAKNINYIGTGVTNGLPHGQSWAQTGGYAHMSLRHKMIGLNPDYYGNPAKFQKALSDGVLKRSAQGGASWIPQGTGRYQAAMTHEFGHHADYFYAKRAPVNVRQAWHAARLNDIGAGKELSIYSLESGKERVANAFAAIHHGTAAVKNLPYVSRMKAMLDAAGRI